VEAALWREAYLRAPVGRIYGRRKATTEATMETAIPVVEPVKNGFHALSRALNLAVWGGTEDEARERFEVAAAKAAEIRARPDPDSGRTPPDLG
jgi:hypothetical protein